ncbi:MAG: ParB/RepB/Spo0J family partition protein [Treponema sp.]|nr:ParB/RepB/Spo0J family partition protein [Treponema sp.]
MAPKFRLGKGLDALLPPERNESPAPDAEQADAPEDRIRILPLDALTANPNQARKRFDEDKLRELADSIRRHGVIDPLIVEAAENGRYVIIGGERRYRAAALAGLSAVPALIRRFSDAERMEVALVENIQRADLNPVEEALAYRKLMELTGLSQDEVALRVGKNRSTVANTLRLLKLPPVMLEALEQSALSSGHGRALLAAADPADQEGLFQEILSQGLSVRDAEKRAAALNSLRSAETSPAGAAELAKKPERPAPPREAELTALEQRFIDTLGTKVSIQGDFKKGCIKIEYYSMEDLERLLEICAKS